MKKGMITGVALGPGDPELITIKALKCLQSADVIFYPTTVNSKGIKSSMAYKVLAFLDIDLAKLKPVEVAMKYDRSEVQKAYFQLAKDCIGYCQNGKNIAVVSEGDISFYSTFAYLLGDFKSAGVDYDMIPGVPAFILAGSLGKFPICTQTDKVIVVPEVADKEELLRHVIANETIVLMKVSKIKNWIASFLADNQLSFFYGEYMGTDKEFTTSKIEEVKQRVIPYFSIIIIKK